MNLEQFNHLSNEQASTHLRRCCAAENWVAAMTENRPYREWQHLNRVADQQWQSLQEADWLEAFSAHPQIGNVSSLRAKFADTQQLAAGEQGLVSGADDATLTALARLNQLYFEKFGFIFIICATGKSAAHMLAQLEQRVTHDRQTELAIAAAEQHKITLLRLQKMITDEE